MESNQVITRDSRLARGQGVYDALVLDAGLRQSLMTARSLGSRGLRVAALGSSAASVCLPGGSGDERLSDVPGAGP